MGCGKAVASVLGKNEIQEDKDWEQKWEEGTNELSVRELKGEGERELSKRGV